jgi:hypothetical protein
MKSNYIKLAATAALGMSAMFVGTNAFASASASASASVTGCFAWTPANKQCTTGMVNNESNKTAFAKVENTDNLKTHFNVKSQNENKKILWEKFVTTPGITTYNIGASKTGRMIYGTIRIASGQGLAFMSVGTL